MPEAAARTQVAAGKFRCAHGAAIYIAGLDSPNGYASLFARSNVDRQTGEGELERFRVFSESSDQGVYISPIVQLPITRGTHYNAET
jgi:hypothetical protein